MNVWRIWFGDDESYTLEGMTILDIIELIPKQNWNQDIAFVSKIELIGYKN